MLANEMRKLTIEAEEHAALKKKEAKAAAKVKEAKAAADLKEWWLAHGLPKILDYVKIQANKGLTFYEEVMDDCPDYVIEALKDEGFEVKCVSAKRGVRWKDDDTCERYYAHVLTIRWG